MKLLITILKRTVTLKKQYFNGCCFILAFMFVSCGQSSENDSKKIFRYNQASGVSSLDPAFARDQANIWAVNQVYDGLLHLDDELNIVPGIAESWSMSEDGRQFIFILSDNVFFHDHEVFPNGKGRKVVAEDFVYTFNRLIDTETASPGSWIFSGKLSETNPFVAKDDHTFILNLKAPFRPILGILTMQYTFVVPKEAVERFGKDFRVNPVGTGPFKLKTWQEGTAVFLSRNENYFKSINGSQLPFIDGVKITFIDNKKTEYLNFRKGQIDFISGLDASYKSELLTNEGKLIPELEDEITLYKAPYLNTEYLGILSNDLPEDEKDNPLTIKEIRQAINYGFDRKEMIKYLRNGIGIPAECGFVPYGLPSFDCAKVSGYKYDPAKSKELMNQAGFPGGAGLREIQLYTNESYKDLCTFIQKQLTEIGIKIKLEIVPSAFQRELMSKSKAMFFRGSWIADYPDAESYLAMYFGEHTAPPNYTRFQHSSYDSLYRLALVENDDGKRHGLYQQMDKVILEEAVIVPLFYDEVLRFVRKDVQGLKPNAQNLLDLRKVDFN